LIRRLKLVQYATVEGNIIWNNGKGGGSDGVDDMLIANNLLYD
jgi:hypothetical protein